MFSIPQRIRRVCARSFDASLARSLPGSWRLRLTPYIATPPLFQVQLHRSFSSSNNRSDKSRRAGFQLDALPFSVSPETALENFNRWAVDVQGLKYLLQWSSVRIGAAFVPVWSFDCNVRFIHTDTQTGRRRFDWKPDSFAAAYGQQSVVHVPGLAAYAGYSYRRSLVNSVHSTSLVFLSDKTVPFGKWMLRDMKLQIGETLSIFPDPWNATKGQAWTVVKEELRGLAAAERDNVEVQTEILRSRRVYMPTFVIDYKVMGSEYRAFVSGCDAGAGVSGVSHQVFSDKSSTTSAREASHSFLSQAWTAAQTGARVLGPRQVGSLFMVVLQLFGNLAARLLLRVPVIGLLGGVFVGFRKVIQPWMENRSASADWERQREHEAYMEDRFDHIDDFVDSGGAKRYFQANRGRILAHLSGENTHKQGEYDWYKDWEEWARRQWEQQQTQQTYQQSSQQTRQQQQQQPRSRSKPKPDYQWDFNPNDPYSVLKIKQGATKADVSTAFRKEMLKHHPDIQTGVSEAEKARAVERSKYITEAYRKIKTEMKR